MGPYRQATTKHKHHNAVGRGVKAQFIGSNRSVGSMDTSPSGVASARPDPRDLYSPGP